MLWGLFSTLVGCLGTAESPDRDLREWRSRNLQSLSEGVLQITEHDFSPTAAQLQDLLDRDETPPVWSLTLTGIGLEAAGLDVVVGHPKLAGATDVTLSFNPALGDAGLARLGQAPWLASVETLALDGVGATGAGLAALAGAEHLRRLSVGHNALGADLGLPLLPALRQLWASDAGVAPAGALLWLQRDGLTGIRLDQNPLGADGLAGLTGLGAQLSAVNLRDCGLTAVDAVTLAALPHAGLESLSLDRNDLGDEGVRALADASWWPGLETVGLMYTGASGPVVDAVRAGWGLRTQGKAISGVVAEDQPG
jgi:hypothetical protein